MSNKKKIMILSVLALLGIAGWQHWEYHYNTPVAIIELYSTKTRSVYKLEDVSSIQKYKIVVNGVEQRIENNYNLRVLNRKNNEMDITPQEALVLSQ